MAIRVTQQTMYNNMVGHMQKNLSGYMESVEQGASQKKVNRPSDDPAGTYRILTTRQDMTSTAQYQENVDTAKGWLNLADDVLSRQVTTAITGLKTLAEQASTGTYTAEQRKIMGDQARQYFGQLLNLSNTDFEGKSIFAGHKYDKSAFQEGLSITSWEDGKSASTQAEGSGTTWASALKNGIKVVDENGKETIKTIRVDGASSETLMVRFPDGGILGETTNFEYSTDGITWTPREAEAVDKDNLQLKLGNTGVRITVPKGMNINLKAPGAAGSDEKGTLLYVRPAAIYQGDDNDKPIEITKMGDKTFQDSKIEASGTFGSNVMVRIDGQKDQNGNYTSVNVNKAGEFDWSYSTDGGTTWVNAKGALPAMQGTLRLPVPGGYVDVTPDNGSPISEGSQFLIHPARADLGYEIMKDTYLPVNSVGKDVFGGIYNGLPGVEGDGNLFEVVGAFIGYLETNNQDGCQKTLAALENAEKQVLAEATRIGGMENRLEMAADVLSFQKLDQQERLSYVEDIDLTELLTKLTRQQLSYQTVLQSSSMIMQMNLAKYL